LNCFFEVRSNFVQTFLQKKFKLLFEELQTFSNRAKKKNVLEFIPFLPNFPIFREKNELSRRSQLTDRHLQEKCFALGKPIKVNQNASCKMPKEEGIIP
jgi:hypothetical protein